MTVYKSPLGTFPLIHTDVYHYIFKTRRDSAPDDKDALVDAFTGDKYTYGQLRTQSLLFASGLTKKHNLVPGDVILLFSANSIHYPLPLFGALAAGLTITTANSGYTPPELAHQIRNSGAKVVVCSSDLLGVVREALREDGVEVGEDRVFVMPGLDGRVGLVGGASSWDELRGDGKGFRPVRRTDERELEKLPAYLPYSSGTTGLSKGVIVSHLNMVSMLEVQKRMGMPKQTDVVLAVLPLYHIYGLVVLLHTSLAQGATIVVMPKFDFVKMLEAVQRFRITNAYLVPPIILALARNPLLDKYDMSSVRIMTSGAAPLSTGLQNEIITRLKRRCIVTQGYGMTETTATASRQRMEVKEANGSSGALIYNLEARLVSPLDGKDVPRGKEGELWLRGPTISPGYHNNEKADRDSYTPDGWLKTGDVCIFDDQDEIHVVDRTKELIKYKGFQVPPAALEAVLLSSPLVADAAVIGIYSEEQATEMPRAYIVPALPAKGKDPETIGKEVAEYVAGKVANHMKLRGGVVVMDAIPKSAAGKILRKDLRALAAKEVGKSKL